MAALVEVSIAPNPAIPRRERGGGRRRRRAGDGESTRMAAWRAGLPLFLPLPLPCSSCQQLLLLFSEEREHVFLASSGLEASMASRVGALGSRRAFFLFFLEPKEKPRGRCWAPS